MKSLILADIGAIIFCTTTELLEGWSKLGAIGVLGAILVALIYKYPQMVAAVVKPHVENNSMLRGSIDNLTNRIEEEAKNDREARREYEEKHLHLLERFLTKQMDTKDPQVAERKEFEKKQIELLEKLAGK